MKTMILILLLIAPTLAQKPLEPVRVVVSAPQDEIAADVREELRKLRDVAIVEGRPDFEIRLNAKRITASSCQGVALAVLVVRRSDGLHDLTVYVGSDLQEIAAFITANVQNEHFAPYRANALSRRK